MSGAAGVNTTTNAEDRQRIQVAQATLPSDAQPEAADRGAIDRPENSKRITAPARPPVDAAGDTETSVGGVASGW
jgi:hypothetical protein